MKRYTIKVVWPPFNRQPEETETADGEWVYAKEADAALSARDARIASLELDYAVALTTLAERDARIAELERQIEIRNAECRICREMDAIEAGTELVDETNWWDLCKQLPVARAATDAAGGVA